MALQSQWSIFRKKRWLALIIVLAAMLVVGALELTDTTYVFHKKKVPATIPVKTQKAPSAQAEKTSSSNNDNKQVASQPDKVASLSAGSAGATLAQPYGNLVSNHFPGQNGTDTKEQSVCNTTSGARCYIQFTNTDTGKITKLPEQTVGIDGSTLWQWDAKTLTAGKWQIVAIATMDGQTRSVTDSMKLEIQ